MGNTECGECRDVLSRAGGLSEVPQRTRVKGLIMKFRLFRKNKKLKETVDVESGFAEICNRYESKLRELCVDWDELTKKWDLLFESLDERVRNETNETLLKTPHERATASGQVIISFTSVKKSIKKELKNLFVI